MRLTVIGCGDAFGSGGRLNTCFHVASGASTFLIDCGASALIGMRREGLHPNDVDTIFITHLHGDHFGGLPWFLIDALHVSKRTKPLTIVGPAGTQARFLAASEALYPGAAAAARRFDLVFREWRKEEALEEGGVRVTPFEVKHPAGAPPYALRFEADGRTLSFTGDTEWVESLIPAARGADLFISECYQFEGPTPVHLDYLTLVENLARLGAKRVLLTHMGEAMLARRGEVDGTRFMLAEDGMAIDV
jgi:ribonuclease BN (tRNA processing enzyme)